MVRCLDTGTDYYNLLAGNVNVFFNRLDRMYYLYYIK